MKKEIELKINNISLTVELNETKTAKQVFKSLPIEEKGKFWGEEIYFPAPIKKENENPTENLKVGDFVFWPQGPSLALFFGKTPASQNSQPKPASPVTVIGEIQNKSKLEKLKDINSANITVQKLNA